MANGSAHFKKGIVIQILNATGNYPVLPAQRFYPALRETSSGEVLLGDEFFGCARRRTQRGKRLTS